MMEDDDAVDVVMDDVVAVRGAVNCLSNFVVPGITSSSNRKIAFFSRVALACVHIVAS